MCVRSVESASRCRRSARVLRCWFQSSPGISCRPSRTSSRTSWAWAGSTPWRWRTRTLSSWRPGGARNRRARGRSPAGWRRTRLLGTSTTTHRQPKTCCWTCTGELLMSDIYIRVTSFLHANG